MVLSTPNVSSSKVQGKTERWKRDELERIDANFLRQKWPHDFGQRISPPRKLSIYAKKGADTEETQMLGSLEVSHAIKHGRGTSFSPFFPLPTLTNPS